MGLKLFEGFDHHSTAAKLSTKGWTVILTGTAPTVTSAPIAGRLGGFAWRITAGGVGGPDALGRSLVHLLTAATTQIAGVAYRASRLPTGSTADFLVLRVGATLTVRLGITTGGLLQVRNSAGTVLATGTTPVSGANWFYAEIKAFANGASGTIEVHLNGAAEIASTTVNIGSSSFDTLELRSVPSEFGTAAWTTDWDDLYVCDTSGSAPNNTFLGDVRVSTLYATADGAHTDFTPDTGTAHFSRLNEASGTYPDDDTSYVSDATVGHRDSYVFGDLASAAGTVFGVQTNLYARKDDAAVRQLAAVARPVATDRDGATVTLSTSYVTYSEIRETNPDTGLPWTISEINASEFGVKLVA